MGLSQIHLDRLNGIPNSVAAIFADQAILGLADEPDGSNR
jgi:hypothetical protein